MTLNGFFLIATSAFIGSIIGNAIVTREADFIVRGVFALVFLFLYVMTK